MTLSSDRAHGIHETRKRAAVSSEAVPAAAATTAAVVQRDDEEASQVDAYVDDSAAQTMVGLSVNQIKSCKVLISLAACFGI